MADAIRTISPVYDSWLEATMLGEIAEVISRPLGSASTDEVALAQREQLAKELAAAQGSADPAAAAALRGAFARYSQELEVVGLTDAQLAAHYGGGRMRLLLLWSSAKIVAGAPFTLVGAVVHAIRYQIVKRLAKIPSNEGMKATVKLLGCFAAFSLLYAGLGVAAAEADRRVGGRARLPIVRLRRRSVLRAGEAPRGGRGWLPHGPTGQPVEHASAPPRRRHRGHRLGAEGSPGAFALP
jgi:hypothetical protein